VADPAETGGLSRRGLLTGLGAAAAVGVAAGAAALPRTAVKSWDMSTDVLVAGSGAAGVSAAIEARRAGARVLLIESLARFGGSSAMSGGVVYAGGGTALQKALNIEDSVEQMYLFLSTAGGRHPPLDKIQLYCEESAAHFDWLVAQGIPYTEKLTTAKGLPMGDESLYFSGTELAWPAREAAAPAPRGHVPGIPGMNGGRAMMEVLLSLAGTLGVESRAGVSAQRLVTQSDGRIVGLQVNVARVTQLRPDARLGRREARRRGGGHDRVFLGARHGPGQRSGERERREEGGGLFQAQARVPASETSAGLADRIDSEYYQAVAGRDMQWFANVCAVPFDLNRDPRSLSTNQVVQKN